MARSVELLAQQLRGIQGSQVSPNLVSSIKVLYQGQSTPIEWFATCVLVKTQVSVNLHDPKSDPGLIGRVQKAIQGAGFTAYVFSKETVMVSAQFGQKDEVEAHIRRTAEEARVAIRNIRKAVKKSAQDISQEQLQKITDKAIAAVDEIVAGKLK